MAVLVDEAIWPWRGMRWAHLVSDTDLDELHDLAHRIGMPYLAFQGDHYDVHEGLRARAIELGARPTPARELVRALRGAGLRRREHLPAWEWGGRSSAPLRSPSASPATALHRIGTPLDRIPPEHLDAFARGVHELGVHELGVDPAPHEVGWAERAGELLVVASTPELRSAAPGVDRLDDGISLHRSVGERGTYLELLVGHPG